MTYSLAVTGAPAGALPFQGKNLLLSDANATSGAMANAMQNGTPFLCKRPDGSQGLYQLDAERSTPALPILKPVGP